LRAGTGKIDLSSLQFCKVGVKARVSVYGLIILSPNRVRVRVSHFQAVRLVNVHVAHPPLTNLLGIGIVHSPAFKVGL
jgi:hypothetical protein